MDKIHWKRNFYILWSGQAVSVLTSSILQMALIWHLTTTTQSALVLSLASLAGFLPSALLGLVAGTLVDRVSRKMAMIGADLFIAAVSLVLVFASMDGELPMGLILAVLAVRSVGTAFHTPAISAATPLIVPMEELTKCSGYTQSLQTVGYIAGTAIAGVLYPIWSISAMVALDVAGALLASLAVLAIKIPDLKNRGEKQPASGIWGGFKNRGIGIVLSVIVMGVPICLSGLLPATGFWGFAALCIVMGLSVPFYNGPVTALMQERIAPEYLGRVFGLYGSIASIAMPIGLMLSGAFADSVGVHGWFFLTGVLCILLGVVMYLIPAIRKIDTPVNN